MNHLSLASRDVQKSIAFYRDHLGFRVTTERPNRAFLRDKNDFLLAISHAEEIPAFPSWFHTGLLATSAQEVTTAYERMRAEGVQFASALTETDESAEFFCFDPDGYKVEVSWHRERV